MSPLVVGSVLLALAPLFPVQAQAAERPSTAATRCAAADLLARGGREAGGLHGFASAVVQFSNTSEGACRLGGTPRVVLLRADGTRLPVRYKVARQATLQPVTLPADGRWSASMSLSWSNWCGRKPGPLSVKVRLSRGGAVTGRFGGPPGYDFVPGCRDSQRPSRLVLLDAFDKVR